MRQRFQRKGFIFHRITGVKLNNQGSTLLTIIICMALIGILGSLMLSVTMTNLQMKLIESKSKENFYSCETAMEEIRTGLQEMTASAIKATYEEDVLPEYASYMTLAEEEKNVSIQNKAAKRLVTAIGTGVLDTDDIFATTYDTDTNNDLLRSYLSDPANTVIADTTEAVVSANKAAYEDLDGDGVQDFNGASVVVHGITVTYTSNDFQTTITSDIRITLPKFTFAEGQEVIHSSMVQPFTDYVLIADGGIISANATGTNIIQGNVYAGDNGILVKDVDTLYENHMVVINGEKVVTRGNITTEDTAKLMIGYNPDGTRNTLVLPMVWAKNLVTQTAPTLNTLDFTSLWINGISLIKDDLVLEGTRSDARLTGSYVGYTGFHTTEGSAIMINGTESQMDLSGLSPLILAGRAHVSIEDHELSKDSDIMTGESIAFKSNQRAYLVPGSFITNILHNPVTEADILNSGVPLIDFGTDPIQNYLSLAKSTKIAAKQTGAAGSATTLRYYYMNFASGKLADQYFYEFYSTQGNSLNLMKPFALKTVRIPDTNLYTVGNAMSYDETTGIVGLKEGLSLTLDGTTYPDDSTLDAYVAALTLSEAEFGATLGNKTVGQLKGLYSRINHLLTLEGTSRAYEETDTILDTYVVQGGVEYMTNPAHGLSDVNFDYIRETAPSSIIDTSSNPKPVFAVAKGDVSIQNEFEGILVATGNIIINSGASIKGMIISTGETNAGDIQIGDHVTVDGRIAAAGSMRLGTNGSFTINESIEDNYIAPLFKTEGTALRNLFKNTETTVNFITTEPASNLVDLSMSNLLSYENWRKN